MYYVYILKSTAFSNKYYVGFTRDLDRRVQEHNLGGSAYTSQYLPWEIETYIAFKSKIVALEFERYLKSGSGVAFRNKRLVSKFQFASYK
jgi:predicted GIY-YIG superfamily endonuclease